MTDGQSAEKGIRQQYPGMGSSWEADTDRQVEHSSSELRYAIKTQLKDNVS